MRLHLYVIDELHNWPGTRPLEMSAQYDVYTFDPDEGARCCEGPLSHYMDPLYATYDVPDRDDISAERLEDIDEAVNSSLREDGIYVHCSRIAALPSFKPHELPAELPPVFIIEWDDDVDIDDAEDDEEKADAIATVREYIQGNPPV